ncbi:MULTISPECIES: sugar ABC transporter substrate-binding protein [unclassified Brevundimonas]|jgi:multiple sugar transport system substrate-binding protein|uniref:sugar ABC transporter substrate-binding protein n=1 Tax=unclassified Brevundimonas TaxID=2622653 RepID=UPI000ED95F0D|nr:MULTISPECIES: sugar ABC transporter substrate-binding protein [unclassified Brevundimonas]HAJ01974.1 ABC transporter substrate-binding protein [Brevundimonas sp.]|tara:strand:+ start:29288 stop:30565 length:1278 start_codon:yes stop_codon:yes gene_type:complete
MTLIRPDRRTALGWLAGSTAALATAGCGGRSDGRTPLTFWAMGAEGTAVPQLVPEFERRNPGIAVEVQAVPWTAAHQKLLTAYAGDSLPDISQIGNTWVSEMAAIGALSATPAFASDLLTDQFPAVLETNRVDGQAVATPWYVDTRLLFCRTDILSRAGYDTVPTTWAEWKASMHAIKRVAGDGNFAILLPVNEFEQLLTFGLQADEPLLADQATRGNFSSPGFIAALAFYKSLFDEGLAPLVSATQISNVWTEFQRGYFSFYFSGPWSIGDFRRRLPPETQWATAGIPGPTGPGASAPGGSSLAVFRSTRHPEAAWAWVRYLLEPETQVRFNQITGSLPARQSAWEAPALASDPMIQPFKAQLARAEAVPKAPEWERIVTEMQIVAERMVRGEYTPETAAAEIDRRADRLLEKRRWMLERGGAS